MILREWCRISFPGRYPLSTPGAASVILRHFAPEPEAQQAEHAEVPEARTPSPDREWLSLPQYDPGQFVSPRPRRRLINQRLP